MEATDSYSARHFESTHSSSGDFEATKSCSGDHLESTDSYFE
jgi:hypothetical protein